MRCIECIHSFFRHPEDAAGECRESPPTVHLVPVNTLQGNGIGFQSVSPQVVRDFWCGAFVDVDEVDQDSMSEMTTPQLTNN